MTLAAGARLGPYEILSPIRAGESAPPLPAGGVHRGKPPAVGNTGRRPVVSGWGEGRSRMDFGGLICPSPDAPLTPPSPPDGGRGGFPL
jgi:hypothetical protein